MSSTKKVITERDLMKIVDHAHTHFMNVRGFADITPKQIQTATIIEGLIKFLEYEGIEPPFKLEEKIYVRGNR